MTDTHSRIEREMIRASRALLEKRPGEAEAGFRRVLALDPGHVDALVNLANLLTSQGRCDAAVDLLRTVPAPASGHPGILLKLGQSLSWTMRHGEADEALARGVEADPDSARNWSAMLWNLLYSTDFDPAEFLARARRFGKRFGKMGAAFNARTGSPAPGDSGPLRVGFMSTNFIPHPIMFFFLPVLGALRKIPVTTFCYDASPLPGCEARAARSMADHYEACSHLDDDALAESIFRHGLHVLVDLDGHAGIRSGLFARRMAPVQATWIGFPATTGLREMDLLLAGEHELADGAGEWFSEKIVGLPKVFAPCALPGDDLPVRPLPALSGAPVTFGCFNNLPKITPESAGLWAEILKAVPGSRLLLKNPYLSEEATAGRCLDMLAREGVARERVMLEGRTSRAGHLAAYGRVDVALDPLAYSGSTTTCEALCMGVPVVTLPGRACHQRHSLGFLRAAGLDAWVAKSPDDYMRIAGEAVRNLPALARLRMSMRARLKVSPLCDVEGFAGNFVRLLHEAAGIKPPDTAAPPDAIRKQAFRQLAAGFPGLAEATLRDLVEQNPDGLVPVRDLSAILLDGNRFEDLAELLSSRPEAVEGDPLLLARLAHSLNRTGRRAESLPLFEEAARLRPGNLRFGSRRLMAELYSPEFDARSFLDMARQYVSEARQDHLELAPPSGAPPLRVGFVSGNFRRHPVLTFFLPVFQTLNRTLVEPLLYSTGPVDGDFRAVAETAGCPVEDGFKASDQELAERIARDRPHLLVDLDGHLGNNRLAVFARRPAPVQMGWIGFPGTTGLPEMDFLMLGRDEAPPGAEAGYSETLIRMDHGFAPFAPFALFGNVPEPGPLPALSGRPFTFGCFNYLPKLDASVFRAWAEILEKVPGSRLFLKNPSFSHPQTCKRCLGAMAACGIEPGRVDMAGATTRYEHLRAYHWVDVALDPFAYSGSTTTCEALSMGVPTVALPGSAYHQRHSLSFLKAAGLPEWVASSREEYCRLAVEAAACPKDLAELRQSLRPRMLSSPLCDVAGFTRRFEREAYKAAGKMFPLLPGDFPYRGNRDFGLAGGLTRRGVEAFGAGERNGAEGCFMQALAHDPDWHPARVNLLRLLVSAGRRDEARTWHEPLTDSVQGLEDWPGLARALEEVREALFGG